MADIHANGRMSAKITVGTVQVYSDGIDPELVYTKEEMNELLGNKADKVHAHEEYLTEVPSNYATTRISKLVDFNEETETPIYEHYDMTQEDFAIRFGSTEECALAASELAVQNADNIELIDTSLENKADINHTHDEYLTEHQDISHLASTSYVDDAIDNIDIPEVDLSNCATKEELNEVKQSVSNGKELLASAITDKGVNTSKDDTFQTMANNISNIPLEGSDPYYEELYNLRTSNGTNFAGYFSYMKGDILNAYTVDISKCSNLEYMFYKCKANKIDVTGWDTSKVTNINYMFSECEAKEIVGLTTLNTSKVTNLQNLFYSSKKIPYADLSGWDTSKVTSMHSLFGFSSSLKKVNISGWNFKSNTTNASSMLGYTYITEFIMDGCDFSESKTDYKGFTGHLKYYDKLKILSAKNVKFGATCKEFFKDSTAMHTIDVSGCDVTLLTDMSNLFSGCTSITTLDLSTWDTRYVTSYSDMFKGIPDTASIVINNELWNPDMTETATGFTGTFIRVGRMEPQSDFYTEYTIDSSVATFSSNTIESGPYLPEFSNGYDYIKLKLNSGIAITDLSTDASLVSSIRIYYPEETTYIKFANTKVKEVSYLNGTNVTDCTGMFTNCIYLESADLSSLDPNKVVVDTTMFEGVNRDCELKFNDEWDIPSEEMGKEEPPAFINITLHYYSYDGYDIGELILFTKVDDPSDVIESNFEYNDDFGKYAQVHVDYKTLYNITASLQGDIFAQRQLSFTEDTELWVVSGHSNIYIERPDTSSFYFEYTIEPHKSTDKLNKTYYKSDDRIYFNIYLPQIKNIGDEDYHTNYNNIEIVLKDGTITKDLETLACNVETIRVVYNQNTIALRMMADNADYNYNFNALKNIININTKNFTSLDDLFYGCHALESIDGLLFDTHNVTTMDGLFSYTNLEEIDLSTWDTSNVTGMSFMFNSCRRLTTIDISNWDTSNVTSIRGMFGSCPKLENIIGIEDLNTPKLENIGSLFYENKIKRLDLSGWDTSNVTMMGAAFRRCYELEYIDLSTWDTSNLDPWGDDDVFEDTPIIPDWNYDGTNYQNWTLTEEQTNYQGTFPWNEEKDGDING